MFFFRTIVTLLAVFSILPANAGELVLPVFVHQFEGREGDIWSSEVYLTNPSDQPIQVTLARFLPGMISKPIPCDLFMPPTRVVPPQSAVVWTATGLATDLGCAEKARGGLVLRADGPAQITSRLVNMGPKNEETRAGVLSGRGEAFEAIPVENLPTAGTHLLPALMWHRNPCGKPAFDTSIGFANPGTEEIEVLIDVPHETGRQIKIGREEVILPYLLTVPAGSWLQTRLAPPEEEGAPCGRVESFMVRFVVDGPIAVYGSVIDRRSGDPRTVLPVPLTSP